MKRYQIIDGTGHTFSSHDTMDEAKTQCGRNRMVWDLAARMIVHRARDGHDMFPPIEREHSIY